MPSDIHNAKHVLKVIYMSESLKASYSMNCTPGEKLCSPGSVWEQQKGVLCAKKGIGLDGKSPKGPSGSINYPFKMAGVS